MPLTYYELLGIDAASDFKTLKKAYFRKAKECHPDRFNNSRNKEEEFKKIVSAFDVLSDPEKRARYNLSIGILLQESSASACETAPDTIMDATVDDILEELVVGNAPPPDATLATLFSDLERTRVFMTFREGKNLYFSKRYNAAAKMFQQAVELSPNNILYRGFLARSCACLGNYSKARYHYKAALNIGDRRFPPQKLFNIRAELDDINRKQMPFWHSLVSFLSSEKSKFIRPADEEMIDETNRSIANIYAERKKKPKKPKQLKK